MLFSKFISSEGEFNLFDGSIFFSFIKFSWNFLFSSKVIGILLFKISEITFTLVLALSILFTISLIFTILKYIFFMCAINLV